MLKAIEDGCGRGVVTRRNAISLHYLTSHLGKKNRSSFHLTPSWVTFDWALRSMCIFCKSGASKKEQMDALIEFRFGSIRNSSFLSNSKIERNEILKGEPSEAVQVACQKTTLFARQFGSFTWLPGLPKSNKQQNLISPIGILNGQEVR